MASLLRRSILIVAAMIGCAALLSAVILFAVSLTVYGIRPAELLPASRTIAVMESGNDALSEVWNRFIAPVRKRPGATIAAVTEADGTLGTIAFERKTGGQTGTDTIGAYSIFASSPSLRVIVGRNKESVAALPAYRALQSTIKRGTPWIFLGQMRIAHPKNFLDRFLFALSLRDARSLAVAETGSGWVIRTYADRSNHTTIEAPELPNLPHRIFALSASEPMRMWKDFLQHADRETTVATEGILRERVRREFGDTVSPDYDMLPLLQGPAAFSLAQSGSQLTFLLAGTAPSSAECKKSLGRIHASFAASIPATRVTKRTLDRQFTSIDIRDDGTLI